jgi:hypothetical protein
MAISFNNKAVLELKQKKYENAFKAGKKAVMIVEPVVSHFSFKSQIFSQMKNN